MVTKIHFTTSGSVCPFCGTLTTVQVPTEGLWQWAHEGVNIKIAMPFVAPEVREVLISGICFDCQKLVFGEEEEE